MSFQIRPALPMDKPAWLAMRQALWPDEEGLEEGMDGWLGQDGSKAWMAEADGQLIGFAEASLRAYANGCASQPVAFLEGVWVAESHRQQGVGRALVAAVEAWAQGLGIFELGSDTWLSDQRSQQVHGRWGFEETERVVYFRKKLPLKHVSIVKMASEHIQALFEAFRPMNKSRDQFVLYYDENLKGARTTLLATVDGRLAGYGNLLRHSHYEPFRAAGIPELNDLNVVEPLRRGGVGRRLIAALEDLARSQGHRQIGLGVGLGPDYRAARALYPSLGYVADGRGPQHTQWGDEIHLTKTL